MFRGFLRSEFSEENLEFWLACEDYGVSRSNLQKTKASSIYSQFINPDAPKEVGETGMTLEDVCEHLSHERIRKLLLMTSFPPSR